MGANISFNDNDDVQLKGATDLTLIGNNGNKLLVDGSGVTQPVSGTVTANAGTNLNTSALALDTSVQSTHGTVAAGTAATKSELIGAVFNTSLPSLTTGQQAALQVDSSGRLIVRDTSLPTTTDTNYGTVGASTLRTASQIGNATGAADFAAGNSSAQTLRVVVSSNQVAIPVSQSGSWTATANQGTANTAANAWPVKVTDGTDTVLVTTNGDQKVVDGIRNGGVYGALSIPTANTAVEAKVGASRLTNRKFLEIYSNNNGLFWGLDNTVTTTSGVPLVNGQVLTFSIDPDSTFQVWLVGSTNSKSVQVVECP